MKKQRFKAVALSTVISAGALMAGVAQADKRLDTLLEVGQSKVAIGQQSQKRIDKLQGETTELLGQFKQVNKQIEGLLVYNRQLEKQIQNQLDVINQLETSIDQVTIIERQIQPLILKMLDGLEQFVELDMPFRLDERRKRVRDLRNKMDRADITVAEKFRQVLEAYSIESEYGRSLETYQDTLNINGEDRQVNILAVGRVALMYQTTDTELSGAWDKEKGDWVELDDGKYRSHILQGIRIAKKQAATDIMQLPISAPEAAQ